MERQHLNPAKNSIAPPQTQSHAIARYSAHPIEELQGAIGNRAVNQLLANQLPLQAKPMFGGLSRDLVIQPKLTIGAVGDKYEQEADRVSKQVVNQINTSAPQSSTQSQPIQRQEIAEEDDELMMKPIVQRRSSEVGGNIAPELETSIQQEKGSGQPLAENIRKPMEQAFGTDFSSVKIHSDTQSDRLNQSIQARAFTTGQDIFFRQGAYAPKSQGGQELLAHELTHVMQQQGKHEAVQRNLFENFDTYDEAKYANKYSEAHLDKQKDDRISDHLRKNFNKEEKENIYNTNIAVYKDGEIHSDREEDGHKPLYLQDTKTVPHVDHRYPKSSGGTNSFTNARVISAYDNLSKGSKKTDLKEEPAQALKPYTKLAQGESDLHKMGLKTRHTMGIGREFSDAQKQEIYNANRNYYGQGKIISDGDEETPLKGYDSSLIPHIDHITAKSEGGTNYYFNAEVLPADVNIKKSGKKGLEQDDDWEIGQLTLVEYYEAKEEGTLDSPEFSSSQDMEI